MEIEANPWLEAASRGMRDRERARWTGPFYKLAKRAHRRCFALLRLRRMRAKKAEDGNGG